ncbi:ParA family protein [Burkholderia vietnamiensis]|uniref:ParA family protein n=1 Tax=Burkholderia vietnamiensis TaxID=60552 RepID=UPI001B968C41|nr:AAA family ATPase [Burkholderia vietnamiensis]MBR8032437.1 AAA family ATPase [Burkholderia vietnamiensis]
MAKRSASPNPLPSNEQLALFARVKELSTKTTCFFNNKGGVGKTTLVANLAAELALSFKAKVLVVDADPQCNLTQYVLPEDVTNEIYSSENPESIYSVIRPLSLGKGYESDLPIRQSNEFGFDIIIGDPRLALQEDLLAGDWRDAKGGGMRGIRTTFVFAELVKRAKELEYDFVFFDMGPSLGAINRAVLLAMDFFVVPMSIDVFSLWAIRNIGQTVTIWQRELETGCKLAEDPDEISELSPKGKLAFLGYVTQQHKERTGYDEEISEETGEQVKIRRRVQAYEGIGATFPEKVTDSLGGMFVDKKMEAHLGDIRHLGSLAPMSQTQHVPMISVKGTGSYTRLRKQARELYRDIAFRYLQNLSAS